MRWLESAAIAGIGFCLFWMIWHPHGSAWPLILAAIIAGMAAGLLQHPGAAWQGSAETIDIEPSQSFVAPDMNLDGPRVLDIPEGSEVFYEIGSYEPVIVIPPPCQHRERIPVRTTIDGKPVLVARICKKCNAQLEVEGW